MLLRDLVEVSNGVARVSGRLEKIARLAEFLKRLHADEIAIAVAFLSGYLPQGRIGVGWSVLASARSSNDSKAVSLELSDVHEAFDRIARASGAGASRSKRELLTGLLARASSDEQDYIVRLLSGDLRQGALEGVLAEAVAKAAGAHG